MGDRIYAEKIEELNKFVNTANNYICITRPRRFEKSSVADMLFCTKDKFIFMFDEFTFLKDRRFGEYFGFLSYHDGYLKIPNKEFMKEFEKALRDKAFGYVSKKKEHNCKIEEI